MTRTRMAVSKIVVGIITPEEGDVVPKAAEIIPCGLLERKRAGGTLTQPQPFFGMEGKQAKNFPKSFVPNRFVSNQ
jgi:hypothetical protein